MTADAAGVSERERLLAFLSELFWDRGNNVRDWPEDEAEAYRELGWAEGIAAARLVMFTNATDAILAAGFGDVAQARLEAWDEGHDEGFDYARSEGNGKECNPYRTPS